MKLTKKNLEWAFKSAMKTEGWVILGILIGESPSPEITCIPYENLPLKFKYYMETYNENLNHKYAAENVSIVQCGWSPDYPDIEYFTTDREC